MSKKAMGVNYVRPPLLSFKKLKDTKDYTEYKITTHKDAKKSNEDDIFTKDVDSLIFCQPTMNIKVPKPSFMKKSGKAKFAYAFGMFPNPKNGKAAYLDGCILGALGLKRQKTHADVICFITHDISQSDKKRLEVVFDKVIYVPYISPYDMGGSGNLKTIMMDPDIFKNCPNYTKEHPYSHVFFKINVFNPKLFPYEKVCFVDSDLVPFNYYDSLFMLDAPAGWVEYRKKLPYQSSFHWDRCDYLKHGEKIPKIFTDTGDPGASDVNAGLFLVEPNQKEYDSLISELTSPVSKWMGPTKVHKGFYDIEFDQNKSIIGRKFVDSSYCYPEQNYLTKRYSGKWTYIEYAFQSWTLDPCNSFGIHMAAFNPKPWFRQPANSGVITSEKFQPYFKNDIDDIFVSDIPKTVADGNDKLELENISISYELFNDLTIWGLVQFPKLHKFFMKDTEIHGTKISFGENKFKPLSKTHPFKLLKDITPKDEDYKKLSISQQYISNLMNNYSTFRNKVKDKYLSVCRKKIKDRYGDYNYDFTIITYPDHIDISQSEGESLMKEQKVPYGKSKGSYINDLSEKEAKFYLNHIAKYDTFLKQLFLKSKYSYLLQSDKRIKRTKRKNRHRTNRVSHQLSSHKKSPATNQLLYFKMNGCKWCTQFEKTILKQLKKNKKIQIKEIIGPDNPSLTKKYGIKTYPSLVRVKDNHSKLFQGKRTLSKVRRFMR